MIQWLRSLLICGGVLAVLPTVFAERPGRKPEPPPPPPAYNGPYLCGQAKEGFDFSQVRGASADFIGELISILNETRSPDAFLVTLSILQEIKPEARVVVPAIIRNAERLRLFKRTDPDQPTEQQKMIVECIAVLLKKDTDPSANAAAILQEAESLRRTGAAIPGEAAGHPAEYLPIHVEERSGSDPLLGTPGGELKPAADAVIPGKVK